eukprot:CAMPEP_0194131086 /NCGR_PEP_ID=MMETSP0152-20130528/1924_1 /TAXON_ID=1049557 /ORGANISM="Thalassiothrix antarctica, Strain L6-D1" /LENGTH=803 /DNA_ID=CAMNT_0038825747 /DNA_START=50 /DNA_END=2458 /DNA_ORIENTATION=-
MLLSRTHGLDQFFVTTSSAKELDVLLFHFEGGGKLLVTSKELVIEHPDGIRKFTKWLKNPESIAVIPSIVDNRVMENTPLSDERIEVTYNELTRKEHQGSSLKTNGMVLTEEEPATRQLPKFKTLRVSLDDGISSYPLNSHVAVPFENDLFCGEILILCRPMNPEVDDPYWNKKIFSKKRRRFVMQIQGRFKRKPRGLLYFGGEVSEQMKLGLVGNGMCNLLLKFMRSFVKDLSYAFGNKKEVAHISAPAWFAFDSIVITPPGDSPPALGSIEFPESKADVAFRRSSNGLGNWNTTDIFTLTFHSMYIDGPTWHLMEIPFAPNLDLHTFWGDSFFRFVLYDNDSDDRKQMLADNGYFLKVQVEYLGKDEQSNNEERDENTESLPWQLRTRSYSQNDLDINVENSIDRLDDGVHAPIVEELDGEEFYFYDAEEPEYLSLETLQHEIADDLESILNSINTVCPMHIDMCIKSRYLRKFALTVNSNTIFRSPKDILDYCHTEETNALHTKLWSPRLSSSENMRRRIGQILHLSIKSESSQVSKRLNDLLSMKTQYDSNFLKGKPPTLSVKRAQMIQMASFVARAISDHHWVEEWMKVTDKQISFYHPERLQKANFRISLSNIISVNQLEGEDVPLLPNYFFMGLQTLGRTVYLFCENRKTRDDWIEHLSNIISTKHLEDDSSKESNGSVSLISVDNPSKEFLHKSSMWNCKQRRILNCRKFSFRYPEHSLDAIKKVQNALQKASDHSEDPDESNLCSFLDSTALLKNVNVSHLTEDERLVFFVNLYHVMIIHASLVLGPPDSLFKW